MPRPKLLFLLGTRSEAVKALPVVKALREGRADINVRVGATGQHSMAFDQIADIEGLKPAWSLEAMVTRQQFPSMLGRALGALEGAVRREKADCLVVVGDSASALAGALAAHANIVPLAHIEAGVRGASEGLPFPEEAFRRMISASAAFHFAPTPEARDNLLREGIDDARIAVVGDPGLDSLWEAIAAEPDLSDPTLDGVDWARPVILVVVTRRENHAEAAFSLSHALLRIAEARPDVQIIVIPHLNPHIMEPMRCVLADRPGVRVILPLPRRPFLDLLRSANLVMSDSGGIHEEASAMGAPLISLRVCADRGRALGRGRIIPAGGRPEALEQITFEALDAAPPPGAVEAPPDYTPSGPRIAARLAELVHGGLQHPAHGLKPKD